MVVIDEAEEQVITINNVDTKINCKEYETSSVIVNDDSDGFETASDGDGDGDGDGEGDGEDGGESLNRSVDAETVAATKDDSYEDALNEDLMKQKALAQAHDAKMEGNKLYCSGRYEDAILKYKAALDVAPEIPKRDPVPQATPEIPKHESTSQAAPEKPKHESAVQVAPDMAAVAELRSICHLNCAVCLIQLKRHDEAVKECSKALDLNPVYVKALSNRGEALEKLERYDEAISDMKKILELDPSNNKARRSIIRLEPLAKEKMEKMKEEMMAKLKDMGNSILGRFGMSVDNFKAVQDPNTGSYSISFQR